MNKLPIPSNNRKKEKVFLRNGEMIEIEFDGFARYMGVEDDYFDSGWSPSLVSLSFANKKDVDKLSHIFPDIVSIRETVIKEFCRVKPPGYLSRMVNGRFELEEPHFEAMFEVFTTDCREVRELFKPPVIVKTKKKHWKKKLKKLFKWN